MKKSLCARMARKRLEGEGLKLEVDTLVAAAQRGEAGEVRRLLRELVPEYQGDTVPR